MNVTRHKIGGRAKVMVVTPSRLHAVRYVQNDLFFRKLFDDPDMMKQVMETVGSVLYERLRSHLGLTKISLLLQMEKAQELHIPELFKAKK